LTREALAPTNKMHSLQGGIVTVNKMSYNLKDG